MAMTWSLVPNSILANQPNLATLAPELFFGGSTEPYIAIINSFCGVTHDPATGTLYWIGHGGHGDYAGNQWLSFNLSTTQWALLRPPSPAGTWAPIGMSSGNAGPYTPIYTDGTMASNHVYDGTCFIPGHNKVMRCGGIYWSPVGNSSPESFVANLTTGLWENITNRSGGSFSATVWDPQTGRLYVRTSAGFVSWDPNTPNTWLTHFSQSLAGNPSECSSLALDVVGRKIYRLQRKTPTTPYQLHTINLNPIAPEVRQPTTGDLGVEDFEVGAGLFWDTDRLVALGRTTNHQFCELFTMDPATRVWIRRPATGTLPRSNENPAGALNGPGMWKRFFKWGSDYYVVQTTGVWKITPDWQSQTTINTVSNLTLSIVSTPDPSGPIPFNTWTPLPNMPQSGTKSVRVDKHSRAVRDTVRNRHLIVGGDRLGSTEGCPVPESFNTLTGARAQLHAFCLPEPVAMVNFPDNGPYVYDTLRDQVRIFRGFWFQGGFSQLPHATLTFSALSGSSVTCTASAPVFAQWHATPFTLSAGFSLCVDDVTPTTIPNSGAVSQGHITQFISPTQVMLNVPTPTANRYRTTTPIALVSLTAADQQWFLGDNLKGAAARQCGRNTYAGAQNILSVDCIYDCASGTYLPRPWPVSPLGEGSDTPGPKFGVYHPAQDASYMIRGELPGTLMRLKHGTETWSTISMAGLGNQIVAQACQMVIRGTNELWFTSRGHSQSVPFMCRYRIAQNDWAKWDMGYPTSEGVPSDGEAILCYDPIADVLLHPVQNSMTSPLTRLIVFNPNTLTVESRAIPPFAVEGPTGGTCFWDDDTDSMCIWGRLKSGIPGVVGWHYKYAP